MKHVSSGSLAGIRRGDERNENERDERPHPDLVLLVDPNQVAEAPLADRDGQDLPDVEGRLSRLNQGQPPWRGWR